MGWLLRDRPLIIHGALSTPIEGENRSCEPESSHCIHPLSSLSAPLFLLFSSASLKPGVCCSLCVLGHHELLLSDAVALDVEVNLSL